VVAVVMGVITASVGGILRDILGHEESIILRREIYVTASVLGAACYVVLIGLQQNPALAAVAGMLAVFAVRGVAINRGWTMPTYRAREGRSPDEIQ
jgi:uncharacterized membrane protein YeiH